MGIELEVNVLINQRQSLVKHRVGDPTELILVEKVLLIRYHNILLFLV